MDHIAHTLKKDPVEVRLTNMLKTGDIMFPFEEPLERANYCFRIIDEIKVSSDFEARRASVEKFNKVRLTSTNFGINHSPNLF